MFRDLHWRERQSISGCPYRSTLSVHVGGRQAVEALVVDTIETILIK